MIIHAVKCRLTGRDIAAKLDGSYCVCKSVDDCCLKEDPVGTKENPGKFDCYANALPDEPMFVLLARDPDFSRLVGEWASRRSADIACGERPVTDEAMVEEALDCAEAGADWRRQNMGKWRK